MKYLNFKSQYDKYPEIIIKGFEHEAFQGYESIVKELSEKLKGKKVLTIDCYPGIRYEEIKFNLIDKLDPSLVIFSDELALTGEEITKIIQRHLTDDRVFGVMARHFNLKEFFVEEKLNHARTQIDRCDGLVIVYGVGASLVNAGDILVYCDLARWEIQLRYRSKQLGNWRCDNLKEDILKKYKRGYFFEWRIADKHKKNLYDRIDYLLDTNEKNNPKMITGKAFLQGLKETAHRPFRLVPYFDPGVWGGQWMKEVCDLPRDVENYAWSFDGVPEENSIYLRYGKVRVEVPSINVVFREPIALLGHKVHARYGTEYPIRFDFLDTMDGGNLSLQVHPLTEYIQETFGMTYTQDESYYILDTKEDASVYLGVKTGINKDDVLHDLRRAQKGEILFPAEKYINKFPVKKHDHISIPAGTIHCSGKNTMVLEISSTPYIFTFKLWDWGRLGLDGLPRPVHLEHGEKVIDWSRNTEWVKTNLINPIEVISQDEHVLEEKTGLHIREPLETRRHWFTDKVYHHTNGTVNQLNLVEGECVLVESPTCAFEPLEIHYAETFIIPASVGEYTIRPYKNSVGKRCATIKAFIR